MIVDTTGPAIKSLVAKARATFRSGVTRPLSWRYAQIDAMARMINENYAALADALRNDLGVNEFWIDGVEIETVRGELKETRNHLSKWAAPKSASTPLLSLPGSSYIQPEPYGVVLIISPWNYPVSLLLVPMLTALAAGNTVVVKPSELAVHTALVLEKLCNQYLDPAAVVFVQGGVAPTTLLLAERFDFIKYTGNSAVARLVHTAATKHLTPVLLELGGKCPAIIAPSADVRKSIKRIVWGKFSLNMGQTCVSPDYIAVTPANKGAVLAALGETIAEFYPDPATCGDVSRIINARHTERVAALLQDPTIKIHIGGEVHLATKFIAPTVVEATADSLCMQSEIFGPILPVVEFSSVDAIVEFVTGREKPLALYVFSENSREQQAILSQTSSGGACINDCCMHVANPSLPFGGVGESGMGAYHGEAGFRTFSHLKSVFKKNGSDVSLRFPPYTPSKVVWLKRLRSVSLAKLLTALAVGVLLPAVGAGVYFAAAKL